MSKWLRRPDDRCGHAGSALDSGSRAGGAEGYEAPPVAHKDATHLAVNPRGREWAVSKFP